MNSPEGGSVALPTDPSAVGCDVVAASRLSYLLAQRLTALELWGETGYLNRIAGEAAGWERMPESNRGGFGERPGA